MANISYGVNILPKSNNTYTLGNSDYKWNIFANQINNTDVSNFLNINSLGGGGITNISYSTFGDGAFSVTTATSANYSNPHVKTNLTNYITKSKSYKVTYDDTVYELKSHLWFWGDKCYSYIGNLGLLINNTSGVPEGVDNVSFLVTSDIDSDGKLDIWTSTAGEHTFLIQSINYTSKTLPATLIWGDEYSPILAATNAGTFNGTSIGVNELLNTRGTFAIGYANSIVNEFNFGIGLRNTLIGSYNWAIGYSNVLNGAENYAIGDWNVTQPNTFMNFLFGYSNMIQPNISFATAIGNATVNNSSSSCVLGSFNKSSTKTTYPTWTAGTSYSVGDIVVIDNDIIVMCNTANSDSSFTQSKWTRIYKDSNTLLTVGNGYDSDHRSNALMVDWDGNQYISGDLYVQCNDDSTGGVKVLTSVPVMTGATSSAAGASGLVPAPATTDVNKFLAGDGTYKSGGLPMVVLSYGSSTWQDFINAYNNNVIVYCRASSNSNPGTGSQTRMAFMAYVSDATNPTNVEFQYYRSMSSHSATAMGDEVYVYKLTNANGGTWSVTTRPASIKEIKAGTGEKIGVSWNSNVVTLSNTMTAADMPMSSSDATTTGDAIAALNSKTFNTSLPNNTDFNSINAVGTYIFFWIQDGTTYHRPVNQGGLLIVSIQQTGDTKTQQYMDTNGRIFARGYHDSAWTDWKEFATTDQIEGLSVYTLSSSQELLTVARDTSICPENSVRWINPRSGSVSGGATQFGMACVTKRYNSAISVVIYSDGGTQFFNSWDDTNSIWRGWSQLATADRLSNSKILHFNNANSIVVDLGYIPSTSSFGHIFLWNANRHIMAMILPAESSTSYDKFGTSDMTFTFSRSDSVLTITPSATMWGVTTLILDRS